MGAVTKYIFPNGWQPSADAVNAPPDALLRMDNLVLDEQGAIALRLGASKVNSSPLSTTDVRSLYAVDIGAVRQRFAQGAGSVYAASGTGSYASIASGFDSSLDVQFTSYLGHALFASGTVKKKYDGTTLRTWGIAAPASAPTTGQSSPSNKVLASGNSGETTWTDNESAGAASQVSGFDGTANGARSLIASASTFRGVMSRDLGTSTDFTEFSGVEGSGNDLIEFYALIDDPKKVDSITVTVDFNGGSAASYDRDYASHTFPVDQTVTVEETIEDKFTSDLNIEGYDLLTLLGRTVARAQTTQGTVVRPEANGWQYFSARRSQFTHVKTNDSKFWDTVRGVRISFEGSGQATVAIDRLRMIGGATTPLTGTYVYRYIYVREATAYNALGVKSPASAEIILKNQGMTVAARNPSDSQVTHIWLYRMGGFLDAFYRVGRAAVVSYLEANYTASWESVFSPTNFTAIAQFNYTVDWELTFVPSTVTPVGPANRTTTWEDAGTYYLFTTTNITDQMSDKDALVLDIRLETDNLEPPDNIVGISEDYYSRIFCLTSDGQIHPSRRLNPESFSAGQQFRVGGPSETAYWIKKSFGGLYVGTSKDIYRVAGDGAEYPDGTTNFNLKPLNINSPPVDASLAHDGNVLIYRAQDGPRLFQGETSTPLRGATDLLWRGYARHGVSAINGLTGRFRMTISDGVLALLVPEGSDTTSTTVIYKYNFAQQQWYRHTYASSWRSIYREPDGTLVAGDTEGFVWHLENADASETIAVQMWTKADDFGMPFKPKRTESFIARIDTNGTSAALAMHYDGSSSSTLSATPSSTGMGLSSKNLGLTKFRQFQWRLSGSFTTFRFYGYTIQFVEAPESVEVFDSGPIDFATRDIVFVRSLRLKAQTEVTLTLTPYLDGVAQATKTVNSIANEATIYDFPLGREMKAAQPRFVITAPAGQTFEPYWLECTYRASGNMSEKKSVRVTA
jgi:hypothetical protein